MESKILKNGTLSSTDIDTEFLGDVVKVRLLRDAVRMYENNRRAGTHNTKRRGELPFRKAAMFKQKGTGRARVRHPQATQCRHGGIPHGPKPRDYSYAMPKKAKVEALRSALLSKFRDGEIVVAESFGLSAPKTKQMAGLLAQCGLDKGGLVVINEIDANLLLSVRNLRRVEVVQAREVNAYQLLKYRNVVMTEEALATVKERTHES